MRKSLLALAVLSFSICASANDVVIMPGPAVYKCTQWSEAKPGALRLPLAMWLFGFISGSNFRSIENSTQAHVLDSEAALTFADKYCQNNPDHALGQLALAVVEHFGGPKTRHQWQK